MSAAQSTLTLNGSLITPSGSILNYSPPDWVNPNAQAQAYQLALTSSWVEVTLPANTQWYAVQPPLANGIAISHKWITGDTGSLINAALGILGIGVDPSQLTFWLKSASPIDVTIWSA
jgi:hypothetical protein